MNSIFVGLDLSGFLFLHSVSCVLFKLSLFVLVSGDLLPKSVIELMPILVFVFFHASTEIMMVSRSRFRCHALQVPHQSRAEANVSRGAGFHCRSRDASSSSADGASSADQSHHQWWGVEPLEQVTDQRMGIVHQGTRAIDQHQAHSQVKSGQVWSLC